ncbi:MAG: ABC transporter substrate-binding protein [Candidatus Acidiferrales bacterium]
MGKWCTQTFDKEHIALFHPAALIAALACVALLLAGCGSSKAWADAGTVNFLIEASPTNLDPRVGADAYSEHIDGLIFSSLVAHDDQMKVIPDLAQSWETPDPLTYVFHLRSGVRFHDGRLLTSADVKYTFDSIISGPLKTPKRGSFKLVALVEAPDEATLIIHLREPYASLLWSLTAPAIGIVPRGAGPETSLHPIGTGPFRFVSTAADEEIVLARNENYFGGAPQIESVRLRIVPDALVRALELRKGSADATINSLTPDMVVTLAKERGLVAEQQPGTSLAYFAFNFDDPILGRREVRQALAYATDRATIIRYLLRGQARAASSLLPPSHWAFEPNVRQYDFDSGRAEQLLDAAGFPRGPGGVRLHLTLKTSTDESTRLMSEAIADQWKRIGVQLELRPLEFATLYSDITRASFQIYALRWVGANNDPDIFEYVFSSKKIPPAGANRGHYRNAQLDSLLDQARAEMDQGERKALLSEIQKIVAEDEPYINLWYVDNVCVHRDRLSAIVLPPGGDYNFLDSAQLK